MKSRGQRQSCERRYPFQWIHKACLFRSAQGRESAYTSHHRESVPIQSDRPGVEKTSESPAVFGFYHARDRPRCGVHAVMPPGSFHRLGLVLPTKSGAVADQAGRYMSCRSSGGTIDASLNADAYTRRLPGSRDIVATFVY